MDPRTLERMRRDYLESRILSAQPVEIVAMLFQVATTSLAEAIENLKSGDRFARSRAVTRAEQAIHELLIALDHSVHPAFSRTSADLYRYALARIVAGHARESEQAFREALAVLQPLESAWMDLKVRSGGEPLEPSVEESPEEPKMRSPAVKDPYEAYRQSPALASRDWSC
ncbi:MAG TPA: flagellar protein FliS [Bryobacteraceae bacterium]|nr:flagellar protein FliS [Bryobacteraceae bacterium]